ncbi:hypothetical protein [uncultured Kordia sp.]|uniref:hypothetical protein n=1 Tax=uncultured Kordia sp. TaxID=507699 RepID=UPI0026260A80|nr:hypothetical protein [uncultured Kordia sp.]
MKANSTYILTFLSFLLLVNCAQNEKKTTPDTTKTETTTEAKDTIPNNSLEEKVAEPDHYICYKNDEKSSMQISIAFDIDANALYVKYKGQKDSIPLQNIKEDYQDSGAYPTITQFYDELYEGKKNGTYELTHSGNWDYATYRNLKSDKVYKFTIDHDMTVTGNGYRTTPCF